MSNEWHLSHAFISTVDTTMSSLRRAAKDYWNNCWRQDINGLETDLECVIITFNHGFSVLNVCCGLRSILMPPPLPPPPPHPASGINIDSRVAINVKHLKPVIESYIVLNINEPAHDKTNKMTSAPSEDSEQPGQPSSLIRVFACA